MKKLFSVFLCLTVWLSASAYDFEVDGIYYNIIGNGQVEVTSGGYYPSYDSVAIPSSVTHNYTTYSVIAVGDYAFRGCRGLTSVTISNGVDSIGDYAFSECENLTSVTMPNSVTTIGDNAFRWCVSITSVTIPISVTYIGVGAFNSCSLTSVTIPDNVTSIGDYVFLGCNSLTSISVDSGNTHYDSRNNCNAIIETSTNNLIVGCQTTVIPNSVTTIDDRAFYYCEGLTSVTIPNSVTTIGECAFYGCSGLTSVIIGNNETSIGNSTFDGCSGLTSVIIGNNETSIGNYAFYDCSSLTSVIIGNNVTSIGNDAFDGCSGLTSVIIGNNVTSIAGGAFEGCVNITDITCHATIPPTAKSNTFANYDAILYVPSGSVSLYSAKAYWKNFFIQPIPGVSHAITVTSNDSLMGTTLGSGTYEENTNAQLVAVTQAGYSFQQWSDGNTDNPRSVVVTSDSTFTAEFTVAGGVNDTIYLEYDGKDAMQYSLEDQGVYYLGGKVYNSQNLYIKLYYSDGKLLSSGTNDIDMSSCPNGIYIVTDGKGGFLKINHYR